MENLPVQDYPLLVSEVDITALSEHKMPMIIDLRWCVPCKAMAPVWLR